MNDDGPRARVSALEYLEEAILSGSLRVGMQLPPERQLAEQLGVSRGSVREAIRRLQAQGVIESMPGHGRGTRITNGHGAALSTMFRLHLATANLSHGELSATRVALEGATAARAARRWTPETLSPVAELVSAMAGTEEMEEFNELDTRFHVAVVELAENPLIGDLTTAIREALREPILTASQAMDDWSAFRRRLVADHQGIFEAIRSRDEDEADRRMTTHIRAATKTLGLGRADAEEQRN